MVTSTNSSSPGVIARDSRTSATPAGKTSGYLHHLDFVRTITFLLVVFTHALTNTNDEVGGVVANAFAMNLHSTRNAFFAVTGLVLAYGAVGRGARGAARTPLQFWRKRLPLVTIPFVIWAFAYWVFDMVTHGHAGLIPTSLGDFWNNLKWGGMNGYQLYFIFVSIQIYLLFPLILALAERTRGAHLQLIVVSAVLQLGIYAASEHWQPAGWLGANMWHLYATFIPYQFFILAGVLTAFHRERIERLLLRHAPLVYAATVVAIAGTTALYRLRVAQGTEPLTASTIFQPVNLVLYVTVVTALFTTGLLLARHRDRFPRLTRFAAYGAKRSFGIFLVHVMVLSLLLLPKGPDGSPWLVYTLPGPLGTVAAYVLTLAITLPVVELLSRAPKAQWWVGRPRRRAAARAQSAGASAPAPA